MKFNWENAERLKSLTSLILFVVFPFFVGWTILGNLWIVESAETTPGCVKTFTDNWTL
jgi:hypothetical protein